LALVQSFLTKPLLSHAPPAQRIILIQAAAKSLRRPQFSSVRIFLKMFLLLRATAARWNIFLPATVNLLLDLQFAWIFPLGFWPRHASRFRSYAASSVI
jgi:hypothetical protein